MKPVLKKVAVFLFNVLLSAYLAMWAALLTVPAGALIVEEKSLSLFGFVFLCSAGIGVPCVGSGAAAIVLYAKGFKATAGWFYAWFFAVHICAFAAVSTGGNTMFWLLAATFLIMFAGSGVAGRALRKKGLKKSAAFFYAAFALYWIAAVKTVADYALTTR